MDEDLKSENGVDSPVSGLGICCDSQMYVPDTRSSMIGKTC